MGGSAHVSIRVRQEEDVAGSGFSFFDATCLYVFLRRVASIKGSRSVMCNAHLPVSCMSCHALRYHHEMNREFGGSELSVSYWLTRAEDLRDAMVKGLAEHFCWEEKSKGKTDAL